MQCRPQRSIIRTDPYQESSKCLLLIWTGLAVIGPAKPVRTNTKVLGITYHYITKATKLQSLHHLAYLGLTALRKGRCHGLRCRCSVLQLLEATWWSRRVGRTSVNYRQRISMKVNEYHRVALGGQGNHRRLSGDSNEVKQTWNHSLSK